MSSPSKTTRHWVLVVEDTDDIREVVCMLLESEGYEVHAARNGQEALDALHAMDRPCVILLDLMMPVMSGRELLEKLGEDDLLASIPVVVTTADPDVSDLASRQLLRKPVVVEALLDAVRAHCTDAPADEAPRARQSTPRLGEAAPGHGPRVDD